MTVEKHSNYTVIYTHDSIVLQGATDAIHNQADKILKRFAYSPRSFMVATDSNDHIILKPKT